MANSNTISERYNADGTVDYVVNLGVLLYNDRILDINNLVIPLRDQVFFTLPEDKGKYASVNVYYKVEDGSFVFDLVKKSDVFSPGVTAEALSNYLPIAQFILQESFGSFNVLVVNQYSQMATFSITQQFDQGDQGLQGPLGSTGFIGDTGNQGFIGSPGSQGSTGLQGLTGMGFLGATGRQGDTGYFPDSNLLFHAKFKSDDVRLVDYSVYQRDFVWGATGSGYTGVGYTGVGLGDTGTIFIPHDLSSYVLEGGVVDNCHSVVYGGGLSSYSWTGYIGFTGTVQAWIQLDVPPWVDFSYTASVLNPLQITFEDQSLFYPTQWAWGIESGGAMSAKKFTYLFASHGDYYVTLKATNAAGSSERTKKITI